MKKTILLFMALAAFTIGCSNPLTEDEDTHVEVSLTVEGGDGMTEAEVGYGVIGFDKETGEKTIIAFRSTTVSPWTSLPFEKTVSFIPQKNTDYQIGIAGINDQRWARGYLESRVEIDGEVVERDVSAPAADIEWPVVITNSIALLYY